MLFSLASRIFFQRAGVFLDTVDVAGMRIGDLDEVTRLAGPGILHVRFDAGPRKAARRTFILTAVISIGATSMAGVLLLLYVPHSLPALCVFAILYGVANGIMTIVRGTAVPDLLWREGYGAINGAL